VRLFVLFEEAMPSRVVRRSDALGPGAGIQQGRVVGDTDQGGEAGLRGGFSLVLLPGFKSLFGRTAAGFWAMST
jgi:hypothetical protein